LAERRGRQPLQQKRVRRPIALEHAVGHEPIRRALGLHLRRSLAERQRFGLSEDVRQKHVVVPTERVKGATECDEVGWYEPRSLVDELVKRVLAVGAGLSPIDRAGLIVDLPAIERDILAVALHRELLEIGGKALQVLLVRQDRDGLRSEEIVVPYGE